MDTSLLVESVEIINSDPRDPHVLTATSHTKKCEVQGRQRKAVGVMISICTTGAISSFSVGGADGLILVGFPFNLSRRALLLAFLLGRRSRDGRSLLMKDEDAWQVPWDLSVCFAVTFRGLFRAVTSHKLQSYECGVCACKGHAFFLSSCNGTGRAGDSGNPAGDFFVLNISVRFAF